MTKTTSHSRDHFINNEDSGIATSADNEIREMAMPIKIKDPFRYSASSTSTSTTITLHYYPEGGWGWIIVIVSILTNSLTQGFLLSGGIFMAATKKQFKRESVVDTAWLMSTAVGVSLLVSPITIAICVRKSTRLMAVFGGLVTALGCLFTSFATQFHQLFFSFGIVFGVGISMIKESSILMIGQYFKKRRKFIELFIVSSTGLGILFMSLLIKFSINLYKFRLGLHLVSAFLFLTFFLGMFYRSASLYHPQRRAILHLKYQKKKIKEKIRIKERPPFIDLKILRSKSLRIIFAANSLSSFGLYNPIFFIIFKTENEGIDETKQTYLQIFFGCAWIIGCIIFSPLIIKKNYEYKQYICQLSLIICGLSISTLNFIHGNYTNYVIFVSVFGIFLGAYNYSLKIYVYERMRAKSFGKAWSFMQFFQSFSLFLGMPIFGLMILSKSPTIGYILSSLCVIIGSILIFLLDSRRSVKKRSLNCYSSTSSCNCHQLNKSTSFERSDLKQEEIFEFNIKRTETFVEATNNLFENEQNVKIIKPELTCISEEGIADMDLSEKFINDSEISN